MKFKAIFAGFLLMALPTFAGALTVTPGTAAFSGPETDLESIELVLAEYGISDLLYRSSVFGLDSGPYSDSYETILERSDGEVIYTGGESIFEGAALLVKDTWASPGWYLYDLTLWDGMEDISLRDFWEDSCGRICNVSLYSVGAGTFGEPDPVPEPATMLLFGTGLIGLIGIRKARKVKK